MTKKTTSTQTKPNTTAAATASAKAPVSMLIRLLILASVTFIVYATTLSNGFALDDFQAVRDNTNVQQGIKAIGTIFTNPYLGGVDNDFYRPLSTISFAIENTLWGSNPALQHLVNLLLFAAAVMLLFRFLDCLFQHKKTSAIFIACLLFAVHPIHTEVVANIKGRDELLCFTMAIASLNLFLQYHKKGKLMLLVLGTFLYFLSLISKETTIVLPAIIVLTFFAVSKDNRSRSIIVAACSIMIATCFLLLRHWVLQSHHANNTTDIPILMNPLANPSIGWNGRIGGAVYALGHYLQLLFIPYPLVCDYSYNTLPPVGMGNLWVWLTIVLYIGIILFAFKRFIKDSSDAMAYAIFFYLISIALFTNIFFLVSGSFGERFVFLASAGFCLFMGLAVEELYNYFIKSKNLFAKSPIVITITIGLCCIYGYMCQARNKEWADNITLFSADAEKAPTNCRLNYFLGTELGRVKYNEETDPAAKQKIANDALLYLTKALQIYPAFAEVHSNLAGVYLLRNQPDSAEYHARKAYELNPQNAGWIRNLGIIYNQNKKYTLAQKLYANVMAKDTKSSEWVYDLGQAFYNNSQFDSAEYYELKANTMDPMNTVIIKDLARTYFYNKKYELSKALSKKMVKLEPQNADNYIDLSACYITLNQNDSALAPLYKAIATDAGKKRAYEYLSLVYKAKGNADSANKYQNIAAGIR